MSNDPALLLQLPALAGRRQRGELSDVAYAALYFLHWQIDLHGAQFASRRFRDDPRPEPAAWLSNLQQVTEAERLWLLRHYLGRYQFRGVIPAVTTALQAWLAGAWPLQLCEFIPSPAQVLQLQVQGRRPVTVLADYPRMLLPVLHKANGYAFMVHDLEHAYKFYHDPELHQGQCAFFAQIAALIADGHFDRYLCDQVFAEKFDYLISDMNTHWMHSQQYLQAILIEHHLRAEGKAPREQLSEPARQALAMTLAPLAIAAQAA
ncbi:MAG: hypothetical protein HY940_09670 [Gammaproteobacteria bacterium]|nr:hypothetical protein [Gammaproteobacteria bacterium]